MAETKLSKSIRTGLERLGYWVIRVQSGVLPVQKFGKLYFVHCAEAGTPDLLVIAPVWCFLEVKTAKGRLNDDQKAWHAKAKKRGVPVKVVRSLSEALKELKSYE